MREPGGSVPRPTTRAQAVALLIAAWRPMADESMMAALLWMVGHGSLQEHTWDSLRHAVLKREARVNLENLTQVALAAREFDIVWDDVLPALFGGDPTGSKARAAASTAQARPALRLIRGGAEREP